MNYLIKLYFLHRIFFSKLHQVLHDFGVETYLFNHDTYEDIPDASFVSDWFSTHSGFEVGAPTIVLYPMKAPNRRRERRRRIVELLIKRHFVHLIDLTNSERGEEPKAVEYDFSDWTTIESQLRSLVDAHVVFENSNREEITRYDVEQQPTIETGKFLEFGSLVLDRRNRVVFCAVDTQRSNEAVARLWAQTLKYQFVPFRTQKHEGVDVHHTGLLFFIGTSFSLICLEMIKPEFHETILNELQKNKLEVIQVTREQAGALVCVCIELESSDGSGKRLLIFSTAAYNSLQAEQVAILSKHVDQVSHVDMSNFELLGGGGLGNTLGLLFA